jgi:hypothetical protein
MEADIANLSQPPSFLFALTIQRLHHHRSGGIYQFQTHHELKDRLDHRFRPFQNINCRFQTPTMSRPDPSASSRASFSVLSLELRRAIWKQASHPEH